MGDGGSPMGEAYGEYNGLSSPAMSMMALALAEDEEAPGLFALLALAEDVEAPGLFALLALAEDVEAPPGLMEDEEAPSRSKGWISSIIQE